MKVRLLINRLRPEWFDDVTLCLVYILLVATLGPFLFGFHLAELNAPQHAITCQDLPAASDRLLLAMPPCIPMSDLELGLVTSIFTLGGLLGAIFSGTLAMRYGRLSIMRLNSLFFIFGPIAESLARDVNVLSLGRLISGLGAGTAIVVVPVYVAEVAPIAAKGFFGALTQVMTCFGIVVAQLLGLFFSRKQLWRIILASGGLIGIIQFLGLAFGIESPKWTIGQGYPEHAKHDMERLQGHSRALQVQTITTVGISPASDASENTGLLEETPSISSSNALEDHRNRPPQSIVSMFQVLVHPRWARPTVYAMIIMLAQQFCGINSIVFYGVALLSEILATSSALINLLVSIFNLVISVSCAPLSDHLGRKTCLVISLLGMATSSLMLSLAIIKSLAPLAVISVFAFVGSFALGLGPVPFILASELVGTEAVGATQSWALAANWTATFLVAQFFPVLNKMMGKGKIFFAFAALSTMFAALIAAYVPETKDCKSPELLWVRHEAQDDRD